MNCISMCGIYWSGTRKYGKNTSALELSFFGIFLLQIDLSLYLTKVFKKDFRETEDILVSTPEYLEKLGPIVKNADKR